MRHAWPVRLPVACALAAFALWLAAPLLLLDSWYNSQDKIHYPYLLAQFAEGFRAGIWYPRWMGELYGGYGYPSFLFYPPGYFFVALPFMQLLGHPVLAAKASLVMMLMAGGGGAYLLAQQARLGRGVSLLMAGVFLLTPYLGGDIYARGALAEAYAILLCPWSLLFLLRLQENNTAWDEAGFVLGTAAILWMHPLVAMLWLPVVAALIAPCVLAHWRQGMRQVYALLMAVVLASPYWLPALMLKEYVTYENALGAGYDVTLTLKPFAKSIIALESPSLPLALLALAGACAGWRQWRVRIMMCLYIGLLFMQLQVSLPVWQSLLPVAKYLQFGFRLNAVAMVLQYALLLALVAALPHRYAKLGTTVVIALWALFAAARPFHLLAPVRCVLEGTGYALPNRGAAARLPGELNYAERAEAARQGMYNGAVTNEFLPRRALHFNATSRFAGGEPIAEASGAALELLNAAYPIRFRLNVEQAPAEVRIRQLYFPGWEIRVNGELLPEAPPMPPGMRWWVDSEGLMRLSLAQPGEYLVEARYHGPPYWGWRNALIALVMAAWLHGLRRRRGGMRK